MDQGIKESECFYRVLLSIRLPRAKMKTLMRCGTYFTLNPKKKRRRKEEENHLLNEARKRCERDLLAANDKTHTQRRNP